MFILIIIIITIKSLNYVYVIIKNIIKNKKILSFILNFYLQNL